MQMIAYISMPNHKVTKDKQGDYHDIVVKYLISFLSFQYFVENE